MAGNNKDSAKLREDFYARYQLQEKPFGQGGFGAVYVAEDRQSHEKIAAKKIKKAILHENNRGVNAMEAMKLKRKKEQAIENEIKILRTLDHPNIIRFIALVEDDEFFIICMELCEGRDLFDKIITDKISYTENDAKEVIRAILSALQHCHDHGIVHRDLKPENIMLRFAEMDQLTNIRIIDFGLASQESEIGDGLAPCGTRYYMAPEVYTYRRYTRAVDLWSLGVFMMVLFYGRYPVYQDNAQLMSGHYAFPTAPVTVSEDAQDFIRGLMCRDVQQRLTANSAQMHRWLVEPSDESTGTYEFDSRRLLLHKAKRKAFNVLRVIIFLSRIIRDKRQQDVQKQTEMRATVPAEMYCDVKCTPADMEAAWRSVASEDGSAATAATAATALGPPPAAAASSVAGITTGESPVQRLSSFAQEVSSGSHFPALPKTYSNRAAIRRFSSAAGVSGGMARFNSLPLTMSNPVGIGRQNQPPPAPGSQARMGTKPAAAPASQTSNLMMRQFSSAGDTATSDAQRLLMQDSPVYTANNSSRSGGGGQLSTEQDECVRLLALQREHLTREIAKSEQILRAVESGLLDSDTARLQIEALTAAISLTTKLSEAVSGNHNR